jgi:glycosyltransferase involved in cell wall biosynthesis
MMRKRFRPPAACTIISRNYLSHARVLGESYLRHHPGAHFYCLVVDDLPAGVDLGVGRLITPSELGLSYFYEMCFKYDVTELCTAVKPTLLKLLMDRYGEERVAYFDPDILVTRSLPELEQALASGDIVLIPHLLAPIPLDGKRPSEQDMLVAGSYNLGFIGLRDSAESHRMLHWWEERLRDHCRVSPAEGLMVDQKWVELVPNMFPSTVILRDDAYDVAYWNLNSRHLTQRGATLLVNGRPLAFFHFSGFDPRQPTLLSKHQNRFDVEPGSTLAQLLEHYAGLHARHGHAQTASWEYGYNRFDNGSGVHPILRRLYLDLDERRRAALGSPFQTGRPGCFLDWATRPEGDGLSPFLRSLHRLRYDVAAALPDVDGRHREPFLHWARTQGVKEMGYEPHLVRSGSEPLPGPPSRTTRPPVDGVNVCGYLRNESGLGAAARGYVRALQSLGVPVALRDVSELSVNRSGDTSLSGGAGECPYGVNLVVVNADQAFRVADHVGEDFFRDRYNIGVWFWELPHFPEEWHDRFALYDEIWVGSSFIMNTLAPVSPVPVVRVPPVVSPEPGDRHRGRRRLGLAEDTFLFAFVFDFHSYFERKNPLAVVEAFRAGFRPSEPVHLAIKCVNPQFDSKRFADLKAAAQGHRISIHEGYWPAEEMRDLMAACDAYVSLHRSEGAGLTISDAMALGKPVIATDWSGNTDFMALANSYPVRYRLVRLDRDVGPYRAGETWAEPSVEHAAELMRRVFENRDEARRTGEAARRDIEGLFSVEAVAALMAERLSVIAARRRPEVTARPARQSVDYPRLVRRLKQTVQAAVPAGSAVMVVSRGDSELVQLDGLRGWHFPQTADGGYAGYYPRTSADAIAHLEALRSRGGRYLVLPSTAFWWLEFYGEFRQHLDTRYHPVARDESCIIYDLGGERRVMDLFGRRKGRVPAEARLDALGARLEAADAKLEELRQGAASLGPRLAGLERTADVARAQAERAVGAATEAAADASQRLNGLAGRLERLQQVAERLESALVRLEGWWVGGLPQRSSLERAAGRIAELEEAFAGQEQRIARLTEGLEKALRRPTGLNGDLAQVHQGIPIADTSLARRLGLVVPGLSGPMTVVLARPVPEPEITVDLSEPAGGEVALLTPGVLLCVDGQAIKRLSETSGGDTRPGTVDALLRDPLEGKAFP